MIPTRRPEGCLSDFALDRHLAGEVAAPDVRAHLDTCAACTARLRELEAAARGFSDEVFVEGMVARARRKRRSPVWIGAVGALAAAAAVVLWLRGTPPGDIRLKGGLALEIVAKRANGSVETVLPGATLAPGDSIRFRVSAPKGGSLVVVGIDARGTVSPYVSPTPIEAGRDQLQPGAIVLDETRGAERIFALLCARPVAIPDVLEAGRRALAAAKGEVEPISSLDLPCDQSSVLIRK